MTRQISRRAFIGGAAGATALAAGGVTFAALLNREEEAPPSAAPAALTPSPSPTALPTLTAPPPGGRRVITAASALAIDTFDAQVSGKSPVVEILGRTHSRLLNWNQREGAPALEGDLAQRWELPDAMTLVFHLAPGATWHDRPPLHGRPVTAEDVVGHFRRSLQLASGGRAPLAQRYDRYRSIDSVDSPGPGRVRFRLGGADPYLLDTLAGEFALIQAPEAVSAFEAVWQKGDSDHVVGSGPWTFDWVEGGAQFSAWRSGHRQPQLDELIVTEPLDVAQRFSDGRLDEAFTVDRRDAAALRSQFTETGPANGSSINPQRTVAQEVAELRRSTREVVVAAFDAGSPPWNNPVLVGALSAALNRYELGERLFGGRAAIAGPIPPAMGTPGISAERLKFVAGYSNAAPYDSAGNVAALRAAWSAAGGPGLGAVTVDFPSIFDPLYSASSVVIEMLNETLGPQFRPGVETYTTISKRTLDGYYGNGRAAFWLGWGPPISTVMPGRHLAETYGSALEGQDAMVALMERGHGGVMPLVQQYTEVFRRSGLQDPEPTPFWGQHQDFQRSGS